MDGHADRQTDRQTDRLLVHLLLGRVHREHIISLEHGRVALPKDTDNIFLGLAAQDRRHAVAFGYLALVGGPAADERLDPRPCGRGLR